MILNKILNRRKGKLVTIIFILTFVISLAMNSQVSAISEDKPEKQNNFVANAKVPINEANITEAAYWDDNYGNIQEIFIFQDLAYIPLGVNGFLVMNITNGANPVVIDMWDVYECNHIFVNNEYIYGANTTGVYVLDKSNYGLYTNWTDVWNIYDINVYNGFIYVTNTNGVHSWNITDPLNPVMEDAYSNANLEETHINTGIAYVKDDDRVRILNVTDPTNIYLLWSIVLANTRDVFYYDNHIYFNSNNDLFIFNVTDLTVAPNQVALYDFNETGPNDIYVADDILYIEQGDGLVFVDVSNTSNPLYYAQYETTVGMNDLIVDGNLTYVYDTGNYEIVMFELGSPISTVNIGHIYGYSNDIYLEGTYAFVADDTTLEILDISDLSNPIVVGKYFDDGGTIFKVFVRDGKAYILETGFGLKIIDISDPVNPTQIGNISLMPYNFMSIYVDGEYAYISAGFDGLLIVDIYYPDYPQLALIYDEYPFVFDVEKMDNYLYCASFDYFHILDISNIYNPEPYSNWTRLNALYDDLYLTEEYAYVVSWEGIDIIDITDVANPIKIGQYFNYENPIMVYVDGQYIYLLDANEGVLVYDATIIAHPKKIGAWDNNGDYNAIAARNGYIYIAQGVNGTKILTTSPLLTVKASFLGPFAFFTGLTLFSVIALIFRKKKRS